MGPACRAAANVTALVILLKCAHACVPVCHMSSAGAALEEDRKVIARFQEETTAMRAEIAELRTKAREASPAIHLQTLKGCRQFKLPAPCCSRCSLAVAAGVHWHAIPSLLMSTSCGCQLPSP